MPLRSLVSSKGGDGKSTLAGNLVGLLTWGNLSFWRTVILSNLRANGPRKRFPIFRSCDLPMLTRYPMQHGYHFGSGFDPADAGELVIVLPNGVVIFEESKKLMEIYKQMNRWAVILN